MSKIKKYETGDSRQLYQGDTAIIRIDKADCEFSPFPAEGRLIVGHSETGHHHTIVKEKTADLEFGKDDAGFYVRVKSGNAKIIHEKVDGHKEQVLDPGLYFFGHQYEYTDFEDRIVKD